MMSGNHRKITEAEFNQLVKDNQIDLRDPSYDSDKANAYPPIWRTCRYDLPDGRKLTSNIKDFQDREFYISGEE